VYLQGLSNLSEKRVMSRSNLTQPGSLVMYTKYLVALLMVACVLSLSGCISTTKVSTAGKSVTYKGDLYNVSNIQKIGTRVEGLTSEGDVINMKGMDKRAAGDLLDQHSSLIVSTVFEMDSQELVYQRSKVTSASQFSKMISNFERAGNNISKFMANKKSTQLKLK
jgi:hypothetical protein